MNDTIKVRLTKISGDISVHPLGYWVEGLRLWIEPVVGQPYMLIGVSDTAFNEWHMEYFATSVVKAYIASSKDSGIITTTNSTWKVETKHD